MRSSETSRVRQPSFPPATRLAISSQGVGTLRFPEGAVKGFTPRRGVRDGPSSSIYSRCEERMSCNNDRIEGPVNNFKLPPEVITTNLPASLTYAQKISGTRLSQPSSFGRPPPLVQVTRMLSAPGEYVLKKSMRAESPGCCRKMSTDSSTDDASDSEGSKEHVQSDDTSTIFYESVREEDETSSEDQWSDPEIDHETAAGNTVAAIEAFVEWLDASGQTPSPSTKLTDLSDEAARDFLRISRLLESQMSAYGFFKLMNDNSLSKETATEHIWRAIALGFRGERLASLLTLNVKSAMYTLGNV